jgi:hypothetical protein
MAEDGDHKGNNEFDWATAVLKAGGRDLLSGTLLQGYGSSLGFGLYELAIGDGLGRFPQQMMEALDRVQHLSRKPCCKCILFPRLKKSES